VHTFGGKVRRVELPLDGWQSIGGFGIPSDWQMEEFSGGVALLERTATTL